MQTNDYSAAWATAFDNYTTAYVRRLIWHFEVAWKREIGNLSGFAMVGFSQIAGLDVIAGSNDVISPSDLFDYYDETERLISASYDRALQEPLGGMSMCVADFVIDNTDGRFTPNKNATIGTAILPNRPIHFGLGFTLPSPHGDHHLNIFKGLSFQPKENKSERTLSMTGYDYLQYLNEYPLESTIYVDQRSDQIIADILTQVGFDTFEYDLDTGLNTIGFAWFQKGDTAGERIRRICEAEEAIFYQDENGIIRFENRNHFSVAPYNASVWDLETDDIVAWEQDDSTEIINRAIVKSSPRALRSTSIEVWRAGAEEVLAPSESRDIWIKFDNPVVSATSPADSTDITAFTATGGAGSDITTDVDVVLTLFTTDAKLTITNNNAGTAYINFLRLRGIPALITSEITVVAEEATSISKYGTKQIEIENDYIDDEDFADYLARAIVTKYSEPTTRIQLTVQGVPQIQLRDYVKVKDIDTGTYRNFRVMRIQGQLVDGMFTQILTLREIVSTETD